jgi:hypothetical protein
LNHESHEEHEVQGTKKFCIGLHRVCGKSRGRPFVLLTANSFTLRVLIFVLFVPFVVDTVVVSSTD